MSVDTPSEEYQARIGIWQDIDRVIDRVDIDGFLRTLNASDTSKENKKRNQDYKDNAVFYNFTARTLAGLVGEIYGERPEITLPSSLEYLNINADGAGNSLEQISKEVTTETIKKGRVGIYTSFPQRIEGRPFSAAEINAGINSTMKVIDAKRIIRARNQMVNGILKLSLVVFSDPVEMIEDDGFAIKKIESYRVLRLRDGIFNDERWIKVKEEGEDKWEISVSIPTDRNGAPFDHITFTFAGSVNNDIKIDKVDMSDLTYINIGHYRNSADYEDSVFYNGQSQPWMSGVDQAHMELLDGAGVYVGSRRLMPVPAGERFDFAVAQPNTLARQAMLDKFELALALGARFIQPNRGNKTATQAEGEEKIANSTLGVISQNVSNAIMKSIGFVGEYMGVDTSGAMFELKDEFVEFDEDPQMVTAKVAAWNAGAIPDSDHVNNMKASGLVDKNKTTEEVLEALPSRGI